MTLCVYLSAGHCPDLPSLWEWKVHRAGKISILVTSISPYLQQGQESQRGTEYLLYVPPKRTQGREYLLMTDVWLDGCMHHTRLHLSSGKTRKGKKGKGRKEKGRERGREGKGKEVTQCGGSPAELLLLFKHSHAPPLFTRGPDYLSWPPSLHTVHLSRALPDC